ncbi:hypothetical protein [Pseudoalteromonas aurantia]|uniref:Uncharacterized protein n=1 Tax=Pseudoalteromonas aurantia TaxID=43654 RepID=A0ABY2VSX5_9GAMM|nr:hypothetical protein [Pseudoalteromonas aurantia]TMO58086.1 hypothetical protein CWC18_18110 [Pseudoalteromonas aurantia]TMO70837.1 hypothetical protein CWC20_19130 [Pseudoalteromonas aurantia]
MTSRLKLSARLLVIFWAIPFTFFPIQLLEGLGLNTEGSPMFIRLLGAAYLTLSLALWLFEEKQIQMKEVRIISILFHFGMGGGIIYTAVFHQLPVNHNVAFVALILTAIACLLSVLIDLLNFNLIEASNEKRQTNPPTNFRNCA